MSSGKFLGYMVTKRGIEASPEQIKAIIDLESPKSEKDVQKLTGRVAELNRFISRSSERCKVFYDTLKKNIKFEWTVEHEAAFQQLKEYLSSPPLLSKTEKGEPLSLYLSVTEHLGSAVLVKEVDSLQHLVYYVSKKFLECGDEIFHLGKVRLDPNNVLCQVTTIFRRTSYLCEDESTNQGGVEETQSIKKDEQVECTT